MEPALRWARVAILAPMRMTIATRIFLSLTALSVLLLVLNAVVSRWNFNQSFLDYVAEQETERLSEAATVFAEIYRSEGSFDSLADDPRRFHDILQRRGGSRQPVDRPQGVRPNSRPPRERRGPHPAGRPPRKGPAGAPGRSGPPGGEVSLVDATGTLVLGPQPAESARRIIISIDGVAVGELAARPLRQLTNPEDRAFSRDQLQSLILTVTVALALAAVIAGYLARQLTHPVRSLADGAEAIAAGNLQTRVAIENDDELGALASNFNSLAETLEANSESRRRWGADIAHELRTPLAILKGELDALQDGVRQFDASTLRSLQAETVRLEQLIADLHDLTVFDQGRLEFRMHRVDLSLLLERILGRSEHRLAEAELSLSRSIEHGIHVNGDETRLDQLFTNLIENAIRYTDTPGSLTVTASRRNGGVDVEFYDSPPGVPDDALEKLFDRLYRIDAARSRETGGSGLGLAIARAIVEAHGGSIEARHSAAGGLSICCHFPVVREPTP